VKIALHSMEGGMRTEFCVCSCIAAHDDNLIRIGSCSTLIGPSVAGPMHLPFLDALHSISDELCSLPWHTAYNPSDLLHLSRIAVPCQIVPFSTT
jgi:hypothetical protein